MLVGLDVNQNKNAEQSAVAMVSSFDRDFVCNFNQVEFQRGKQEVMEANLMKKMMTNALQEFADKNRVFPKNIVVYRDGVADTQTPQVMQMEVKGVRAAISELGITEANLTYIIIQKRVNARFMIEKEEDNGRTTVANVPLGTIVDNVVVSSQNWDWYLVPAEAPENCTNTPTRFIVLVDDSEYHQDPEKVLALEAFTQQLCSLYYNWSGPVRVPSCVKNADKLSQQYGSQIG